MEKINLPDATSGGNLDNTALSAFRDYLVSLYQLDNRPTAREVRLVEEHIGALRSLSDGLEEDWVRPDKTGVVSHGVAIELVDRLRAGDPIVKAFYQLATEFQLLVKDAKGKTYPPVEIA